jgi:hypothetical protein
MLKSATRWISVSFDKIVSVREIDPAELETPVEQIDPGEYETAPEAASAAGEPFGRVPAMDAPLEDAPPEDVNDPTDGEIA